MANEKEAAGRGGSLIMPGREAYSLSCEGNNVLHGKEEKVTRGGTVLLAVRKRGLDRADEKTKEGSEKASSRSYKKPKVCGVWEKRGNGCAFFELKKKTS